MLRPCDEPYMRKSEYRVSCSFTVKYNNNRNPFTLSARLYRGGSICELVQSLVTVNRYMAEFSFPRFRRGSLSFGLVKVTRIS